MFALLLAPAEVNGANNGLELMRLVRFFTEMCVTSHDSSGLSEQVTPHSLSVNVVLILALKPHLLSLNSTAAGQHADTTKQNGCLAPDCWLGGSGCYRALHSPHLCMLRLCLGMIPLHRRLSIAVSLLVPLHRRLQS